MSAAIMRGKFKVAYNTSLALPTVVCYPSVLDLTSRWLDGHTPWWLVMFTSLTIPRRMIPFLYLHPI